LGFPTKSLHASLLFLIHARCTTHPTFIDLIIPGIFGMNETRSVKKIFEGKLEGRRGRG